PAHAPDVGQMVGIISMRKVEAEDVDPRLDHLKDELVGGARWSEGGDNLGALLAPGCHLLFGHQRPPEQVLAVEEGSELELRQVALLNHDLAQAFTAGLLQSHGRCQLLLTDKAVAEQQGAQKLMGEMLAQTAV